MDLGACLEDRKTDTLSQQCPQILTKVSQKYCFKYKHGVPQNDHRVEPVWLQAAEANLGESFPDRSGSLPPSLSLFRPLIRSGFVGHLGT